MGLIMLVAHLVMIITSSACTSRERFPQARIRTKVGYRASCQCFDIVIEKYMQIKKK